MAKLTKRNIDAIRPPESGYRIEWDDELKGFGVKVTGNGTKTFICFYRNKRKQQRRVALGRYGIITAIEARKEALSLLGRVTHGEDPVAEQKYARGEPTLFSVNINSRSASIISPGSFR